MELHVVAAHAERRRYNGHWKNGKHDGGGRMEYASGSTYDGIWKEGRRQGEGTLKFASGVTSQRPRASLAVLRTSRRTARQRR